MGSCKTSVIRAKDARLCLEKYPPTAIVWDINKPDARPPWGDNIADTITNMGNYFVSSTGRDLFELLVDALEASYTSKKMLLLDIFRKPKLPPKNRIKF